MTPARPLRRLGRALQIALAVGLVATFQACGADRGMEPDPSGSALLPFHVSFGAATPVATLVVTITGPGITPALVYNLPIVAGSANGTLTVPVGSARLITAQAFDNAGIVLFSGSTTITVNAGTNPTVSFALVPGVGSVPVTAVIGSVAITLAPPSATVRAGSNVTIVPTVKDALGAVVGGAVVGFATGSPPTAWATTGGVVTGLDAGTVTITATSLGSAATSTITVTAGTSLDLLTLVPATASAAVGASITASVNMRDASTPGVDSLLVTLTPPVGVASTCKARNPAVGTRNAGTFACTLAIPVGGATGTWTPSALTVWWGGPPGGGGGSITFTPELLNARGVTAVVTVTP